MKASRIILAFACLFFIQSVTAKPIRPRKIRKLLQRSEILKQYHVGFALYDLANKKMLAEQLSDKYFTPASNTKLFTFYTGLKMLKDSVPGLQYIERGDSLIFWGTGDPSFLHPDFTGQPVLKNLQSSAKNLYWSRGRYTGDFYGTGWSYDDYNEYYQPEISELPIYGNIIRLEEKNGMLISSPAITTVDSTFKLVTDTSKTTGNYYFKREILDNVFHQPMMSVPDSFMKDIPYKVNPQVTGNLLSAQLPAFIGMLTDSIPEAHKTWYSLPADTLFKRMLLPSDNFIAEQLLLTYAAENNMEMNTQNVIAYAMKNYLADLPDKPQWVDGSGMSRQNLFTPRTMVRLCEKIYEEVGNEERLYNLLPQGGVTGTLKNLYKGEEKPYVFAKTGSLSNNATLSGYLITKEGKKLIFSFMNNSFVLPTSTVRDEMERIITYIHENY